MKWKEHLVQFLVSRQWQIHHMMILPMYLQMLLVEVRSQLIHLIESHKEVLTQQLHLLRQWERQKKLLRKWLLKDKFHFSNLPMQCMMHIMSRLRNQMKHLMVHYQICSLLWVKLVLNLRNLFEPDLLNHLMK